MALARGRELLQAATINQHPLRCVGIGEVVGDVGVGGRKIMCLGARDSLCWGGDQMEAAQQLVAVLWTRSAVILEATDLDDGDDRARALFLCLSAEAAVGCR